MLDRGIGIAGLGFTILFGALQFLSPAIPKWLLILGAAVCIFMVGTSVGLIWSQKRNAAAKISNTTHLKLHIYENDQFPDRIDDANIFRWYFLRNIFSALANGSEKIEYELPTLFITFEPDVKITTIKVRSPDMQLPRFEVKEFNQKFAIIVFSEKLPSGTLEIDVEP